MSNYTVITDWDGKDALADTNPAKVISGDEFQDEFDAISTAVATKADINGNAAETFSAATAASGTNTTQVATTAYVQGEFTSANINDAAYPVGSIYISVVSTNPATLLGVGTWTAFAEGRMLVGLKSTDTDFDTVEETGGAKTHTLTVDEMPSHSHTLNYYPDTAGGGSSPSKHGDSDNVTSTEIASDSTGGGSAHDIMNPYIVTYMWKRTA